MTGAALANAAWLSSCVPAWMQFLRALRNPADSQSSVLAGLLARNSSCVFGVEHGFGEIRDYDQFRERVPVRDYSAFQPWIERLMSGEKAVLTSEPALRLLSTGRSTGGRKLIPFTRTFQRELNAAVGPWMVDLQRSHPGALGGPMYWSVSPAVSESNEESAVPVGFEDDSAYVGPLRRWLVESAFAVPSALRLASDAATSRYVTLLCLLRTRNLRLVSVWHPSFLTLMLDSLAVCWDALIDDVETGRCSRSESLPALLRDALTAPPDVRRAGELKSLGPRDAGALWPKLRVVSCWADAQSALPAAALQRRLHGVEIQPKGLLATEAVITIPFAGAHPLAVRSHFYEFEDVAGGIHRAHQLRQGTTYGVIVTTGGGLWRYRLGDLVQVNGFIGATPSLRFLGREGGVSDLCGEKLSEAFVSRCIESVFSSMGAVSEFAMLAPEDADPPRYTLFLEGDFPAEIPVRLERTLRENPHYALCRDLGQLGPIDVCRVCSGQLKYQDALAAEGRRRGDIKPQSLSNRKDWRAISWITTMVGDWPCLL